MAEDISIEGYRQVSVMQTGQNSEVWEVVEQGGHRRLAMKLILPEKETDPEQRMMLRHEATVGLELQHPNIIRFHSVSMARHNPHILMEYFPSQNLKLRLMRKQYAEFIKPNLRKLIFHVANALEHMHEKKWVHRDIKPDNILVNGSFEVRLIDFALSVRVVTGFMKRFKRKIKAAGTRSYMSPEQILGWPLDGRSDIYSLGIVLFEICAGRLPYTGQSGNDLLKKHFTAAVPSIDSDRNVTPEFEKLIIHMLEKKPENRPESMAELKNRIRQMKIFKDEVLEQ